MTPGPKCNEAEHVFPVGTCTQNARIRRMYAGTAGYTENTGRNTDRNTHIDTKSTNGLG